MGMDEQAALIAAFNTTEATIRAHLVAYVLGLFGGLGSWRDRDGSRFAAQVVPVVAGAQRQVASLMDAYLSALLSNMRGTPVRPAGTIPDLTRLRGDIDPHEVYARPFHDVWSELAAGKDFSQALAAGERRAWQITTTDLQLAKTHTAQGLLGADREVVGYRRVLTGTQSCGLCVVASTQRYHKDRLMPIHPGCVVEGTRVSARELKAITRRRYSGELIVVATAAGDELTVTPKHPVLTEQGWVPADLLSVGHRIVRGGLLKGMSLGGPGEDHRPSTVEDVWRSLSMLPVVSMPVAAEDFHGDGSEGEVDVIYVDRGLHSVFAAEIIEILRELQLMARDDVRGRLQGLGTAASLLPACGAPQGGAIGGGGLGAALLGGHVSGANLSGLGVIPPFNALTLQGELDSAAINAILSGKGVLGDASSVFAGDFLGGKLSPSSPTSRFDPSGAEFFGEGLMVYADRGRRLLNRLSGKVEFDSLVDVRRIDTTSSHVYNLHTAEGWYSADRIIVSNCDCGVAPILGDTDPGHVINAPLLEDVHDAIRERFGVSDRSARAPDYRDLLVTYEHGEIGPILARRGQSFTGPSDLA